MSLSEIDQRIEDAFEELSAQQAIFVREYVDNGANGPAAAAAADYCPGKDGKARQNGLNAQASRLLNKKRCPKSLKLSQHCTPKRMTFV